MKICHVLLVVCLHPVRGAFADNNVDSGVPQPESPATAIGIRLDKENSIFRDAVWMKDLIEEDGIYRDKLYIVTSIRSGEKRFLEHTGWVKKDVRQVLKKNRAIIKFQLRRVILGKMILGKRQGLWKEFNEDGNKISEGHYKDNVRYGAWTFWWDSNQIEFFTWKISGQMTDGKREGLWTGWDKDGSKSAEGHYLNNQQEGLWIYYKLHGVEELRQTVQMVAGERQGLETTFWNGRKIEEGHYKDNEKEGLWKTWGKKGQKETVCHYLKSQLDGPVAKWHKNGQKASEGHYKNDKLWSMVGWNPDGQKNETNLMDGNGIVIVPDWQENHKYLYRDGKEVGGYKDGNLVMKKVYELPAGGAPQQEPVAKVARVIRDVSRGGAVKPNFRELSKHPYVVGYGKGEESGFSGGANPGMVRFIRLEYTGGDWDQDFGIGGDQNLLMEYHRRTGHKVAKMTESRRIMQLKNFPRGKSPPMVYMTGQRNISVTPEEIKTLREYLVDKRGMFFADNGGSNHWHRQFFNLMKKVLPTVHPVRVPLDHPIHQVPYPMSFLPYVAPHGGKVAYGWRVGGRLVAYYHPGDLGDAWADGHAGLPTQSWEACCQLGVNVIFYAHMEFSKSPAHSSKSLIPTESKQSIPKVPVTGEQNATNSKTLNPLNSLIDDLLDDIK